LNFVGVLLDVDVLIACIRENVGDVTFQEAYNRNPHNQKHCGCIFMHDVFQEPAAF
jgi:hypothetical protein